MIAVLHDLNLAARYADRIVLLAKGKVVSQGLPEHVITPSHIREVFCYPAEVCKHPFLDCPIVYYGRFATAAQQAHH